MATDHWKSGVNGAWADAADWSGGSVPGSGDTAVIDASGTYKVTVDRAESAAGITLDAAGATLLDENILTLGGALDLTAGTFDLASGGEINGGTLSASGGAFAWNGGTLSGVTYEGTLTVISGQTLTIDHGFGITGAGGSGAGLIEVDEDQPVLDIAGGETLNNATLNLGSGYGATVDLDDGPGAVLTLGANFHIVQNGEGWIGDPGDGADDAIIFDGTLTAATGSNFGVEVKNFTNNGVIATSNETNLAITPYNFVNGAAGVVTATGGFTNLTLGGDGAWTNDGAITVSDGARAYLGQTGGGSMTNNGSITVDVDSEVWLSGAVTTATLSSIDNDGGLIAVQGTLNNTGAVLAVGAGSADALFELSGPGVIVGGVVEEEGSGFYVASGGALSGVTFEGTLDITAGQSLNLANGFTLTGSNGTGPGFIDLTGEDSFLYADGGETLDNITLDLGTPSDSASAFGLNDLSGVATTLTLGMNFNIVQSNTLATITAEFNLSGSNPNAAIVDEGSIEAGEAGGKFLIDPPSFTNDGTITVSNGDTLTFQPIVNGKYLAPGKLANLTGATLTGGTYEVDAGSVLELGKNARIATDDATIILSGAGSAVEAYNTAEKAEVQIDATLKALGVGGVLELLDGRSLASSQAFLNRGTIELGGGGFTEATLTNSGTVEGFGAIGGPVVNNQTLGASGGVLEVDGAVTGKGRFVVGAGATLKFDGAATAVTATFAGASGTLGFADPDAFAGKVAGFAAGDTIDLIGIVATSVTRTVGTETLVFSDGGATVASLTLSGNYVHDTFTLASDGAGGTKVTVMAAPAAARLTSAMAAMAAGAGAAHTAQAAHSSLATLAVSRG